jgi:hypothetical protein
VNAKILKTVCLLIAMAVLSSCATTSLVESWRSPYLPGHKLHQVLVVGLFNKSGNCLIYEDLLASELTRAGVAAMPGHAVIPAGKEPTREVLEEAVKKAGADAVITMQTVGVEQKTAVQPGYATVYPDYWYPPGYPRWDPYGYYGYMSYYSPPYVMTYEVEKIQVNLFDAGSGSLLWAATIQTSEPGNFISVSKELAAIVVRSLGEERLI